MSGWGLRKQRSAPPCGPCGSGSALCFTFTLRFRNVPMVDVWGRETEVPWGSSERAWAGRWHGAGHVHHRHVQQGITHLVDPPSGASRQRQAGTDTSRLPTSISDAFARHRTRRSVTESGRQRCWPLTPFKHRLFGNPCVVLRSQIGAVINGLQAP